MLYMYWVPSPIEVASDLYDLEAAFTDFSEPITRSIQNVIIPSLKENFSAEGRPKWTPLAAYTVQKKGFDKILYETGKLESAASSFNSWSITDHKGELSASRIPNYSMFHNTGFFNVPFNKYVPARTWALYQLEDLDEIAFEFAEWIAEKIDEIYG